MPRRYTPGELRIRSDSEKWTAEQWTGTHWLFLQIRPTRKDLDKWLEESWKRFPVDKTAAD